MMFENGQEIQLWSDNILMVQIFSTLAGRELARAPQASA